MEWELKCPVCGAKATIRVEVDEGEDISICEIGELDLWCGKCQTRWVEVDLRDER